MTQLEKDRELISKRDKERRSNYFCTKLFLPILWFSFLNNLLIIDSLIGFMKDFDSRFLTMFPFKPPEII